MNEPITSRVPINDRNVPITDHVPITNRDAFRGPFLLKSLAKDVFA